MSVAAGSQRITSSIATHDGFFLSIPGERGRRTGGGGVTKFCFLFCRYLDLHLFVCLCLYISVVSVSVYQSTDGYMGIKQARVLGPGGETKSIRVPVRTGLSQNPQTRASTMIFSGASHHSKNHQGLRAEHVEGSRNWQLDKARKHQQLTLRHEPNLQSKNNLCSILPPRAAGMWKEERKLSPDVWKCWYTLS